MALKKLFDGASVKVESGKTKENIEDILETTNFGEAKIVDKEKFIPKIDFSDPANWAHYGSAEQYYRDSFNRIVDSYPFDGSKTEKLLWHNSSSFIDQHVFDHVYPKSTGYAVFSDNGWGNVNFSQSLNGDPISGSDNPEYILFFGGPNAGPKGTRVGANVYDENTDFYRTSNLRFGGSEGNTIEFWLKKNTFATIGNEIIFSMKGLNGQYFSVMANNDEDSYGAFSVVCASGSIEETSILTQHHVSAAFDNEWHHYRFEIDPAPTEPYVNYTVNLYQNNVLSATASLSAVDYAEFYGVQATIGGFVGGTQVVTTYDTGSGKFSGSIDEFRFWKTKRTAEQCARSWFTNVDGGSNKDDASTELGIYYKFNEGMVDSSSINSLDAIVLDYSGRISHGSWTGYNLTSRNTGSAITDSGYSTEIADPILYTTSSLVTAKLDEMVESGSWHDLNNASSIFNSMPDWLADADATDQSLLKLTQIVGSYFDTLHLQIEELSSLRHNKYTSEKNKPYPFADRLLSSNGLIVPEIFVEAGVLESLTARDENEIFEDKIENTRNRIYENIYNNLVHIFKAKGTEKAFRNLIRCYGVDEEVVKINLYASDTDFELQTNTKPVARRINLLSLDHPTKFGVTLTNVTSSDIAGSPDFITGSNGLGIPYSVEAGILFPKRYEVNNDLYFSVPFATSSLFGLKQEGIGGSEIFKVSFVKKATDSKDGYFALTNDEYGFVVTSSVFTDVYDNQFWSISACIKPEFATPSSAASENYIAEFYGANYSGDVKRNYFHVSCSVSSADASSFVGFNKKVYAGANRTSMTGSLLTGSDVKFADIRFYLRNLLPEEVDAHARDPFSFGTLNPSRETERESNLLNAESLILNWEFGTGSIETVNYGGSDYGVFVKDITSGSYGYSHGSAIDNAANKHYPGMALFFDTNTVSAIDTDYVLSYKQMLPETLGSEDMISISTQADEELHTRNARPVTYFWSFEKSMYQTISEEMLKFFASVVDFNNLIGEPVNRYRVLYKDLAKLRHIFFDRVENTPDIEKYISYYKWIDSSVGIFLRQLVPAAANVSNGVRNMIESHVLERNKYQTPYPTLEMKQPDPEANIYGVNELTYNWGSQHHNLPIEYYAGEVYDYNSVHYPITSSNGAGILLAYGYVAEITGSGFCGVWWYETTARKIWLDANGSWNINAATASLTSLGASPTQYIAHPTEDIQIISHNASANMVYSTGSDVWTAINANPSGHGAGKNIIYNPAIDCFVFHDYEAFGANTYFYTSSNGRDWGKVPATEQTLAAAGNLLYNPVLNKIFMAVYNYIGYVSDALSSPFVGVTMPVSYGYSYLDYPFDYFSNGEMALAGVQSGEEYVITSAAGGQIWDHAFTPYNPGESAAQYRELYINRETDVAVIIDNQPATSGDVIWSYAQGAYSQTCKGVVSIGTAMLSYDGVRRTVQHDGVFYSVFGKVNSIFYFDNWISSSVDDGTTWGDNQVIVAGDPIDYEDSSALWLKQRSPSNHGAITSDNSEIDSIKDVIKTSLTTKVSGSTFAKRYFPVAESFSGSNLVIPSDPLNESPIISLESKKIESSVHQFFATASGYNSAIETGIVPDKKNFIGNFEQDSQVVQAHGQIHQRTHLKKGGQYINNGVLNPGYYVSSSTDNRITSLNDWYSPDYEYGDFSFKTLFSAPGDRRTLVKAWLDPAAQELSAHNALPWRNLDVITKLNISASLPMSPGGLTSDGSPSFHKVNRNRLDEISSSKGVGWVVPQQEDNAFVQHQLPRSVYGYSWVTASAVKSLPSGTVHEFNEYDSNGTSILQFDSASFWRNLSGSSLVISEADMSMSYGTWTTGTHSLFGFASFEQVRLADEPLARYQRERNIISARDPEKVIDTVGNDGRRRVYVDQPDTFKNYYEPPVTWNKPTRVTLRSPFANEEDITLGFPQENEAEKFTNDGLMNRLGMERGELIALDKVEKLYKEKNYELISLKTRELIYPKHQNVGFGFIRERESFDDSGVSDINLVDRKTFWKDSVSDRIVLNATNSLGYLVATSSIWAMDDGVSGSARGELNLMSETELRNLLIRDGAGSASVQFCYNGYFEPFQEAKTDAAPGVYWHSSVVFDNKMWIIGGINDAGTSQKVFYSTNGIDWVEAGTDALPVATKYHSSVVFDNKMWVIGGYTTSTTRKVYYSTNGANWTEAGSDALPVATRYHASVVFNNAMWVIGGNTAGGIVQKVYSSTDGVTWTEAGTDVFPLASYGHSAVVYDNKIWTFGGYSPLKNNKVFYSSDGENWAEAGTNSLPGVVYHPPSVVFNNAMWVIGGYTSRVYFSTDGINWTEYGKEALRSAPTLHTVLVFDGKIWSLGGQVAAATIKKAYFLFNSSVNDSLDNNANIEIGLNPSYNSYTDYAEDVRKYSQNYSILPEFRISEHMDFYINNMGGDFYRKNRGFMTLNGASVSSSQIDENNGYNEEFFKIYSHSDFMKHFNLTYQEGLNRNKYMSLECKAVKKLLPYNGFYPMQRTVQLANLFSQSYGPYVTGNTLTNNSGATAQALMQPFYAPGIMYNTIKSGIAVDWTVCTGSSDNADEFDNLFSTGTLKEYSDQRISFESVVSPRLSLPSDGGELKRENRIHLINPEIWSSPSVVPVLAADGTGSIPYIGPGLITSGSEVFVANADYQHVVVWDINDNGTLTYSQTLSESNPVYGFARLAAVDGDYLAVSVPGRDFGADTNMGSIYLYEKNAGTWDFLVEVTASSVSASSDALGQSIAITPGATSGEKYLFASSTTNDSGETNGGAVYVFSIDNTGAAPILDELQVITGEDEALALGRNILVSGSNDEYLFISPGNNASGSLFCYYDATGGRNSYSLFQRLTGSYSDENISDNFARFGPRFTPDGDLLIGAPSAVFGASEAGIVYVFELYDPLNPLIGFAEKQILSPPKESSAYSRFGRDIEILSDGSIVVGSDVNATSEEACLFYYKKINGSYVLVDSLKAPPNSLSYPASTYGQRNAASSYLGKGLYVSDTETYDLYYLDFAYADKINPYFIWSGKNKQNYDLAANNFVAASPDLFLQDGKFVSLLSRRESEFKTVQAETTYFMDVVLRNQDVNIIDSWIEGIEGSYFGPAAKAFGPQEDGYDSASLSSYSMKSAPANAIYTPPYFYGDSVARIAFTPIETRKYSLDEILSLAQIYSINEQAEAIFRTRSRGFAAYEQAVIDDLNTGLFNNATLGTIGVYTIYTSGGQLYASSDTDGDGLDVHRFTGSIDQDGQFVINSGSLSNRLSVSPDLFFSSLGLFPAGLSLDYVNEATGTALFVDNNLNNYMALNLTGTLDPTAIDNGHYKNNCIHIMASGSDLINFDSQTVENMIQSNHNTFYPEMRELADATFKSSAAFRGMMPLNSSVNLFGKMKEKEITYDALTGKPITVAENDSDVFNRWVISPRFECPVLNVTSSANTVQVKTIWGSYGEIPQGSDGIYLSLKESIRGLQPGQTKTIPQYQILPTGSSEPITVGSLLDVCGFQAEDRKIGQIASSKKIKEAVVAIPFTDKPLTKTQQAKKANTIKNFAQVLAEKHNITVSVGSRNFFAIKDELMKEARDELQASSGKKTSIIDMVKKMNDYVIPPEFNFLANEDIKPFVMYIFEFEHVLDQEDLANIWQGISPKIARRHELDSDIVAHEFSENEFFGGEPIPEGTRWMVFKVKQKAPINYYKATADNQDDDRFKFDFQIGRKEPEYSYNWPYDFFSLVELAQIEASVEVKKDPDAGQVLTDTVTRIDAERDVFSNAVKDTGKRQTLNNPTGKIK